MRYMNIFTAALLFNILAYVLIKLRARIYKNDVFKPMIWNVKLSIMPIAILISGTIISLLLLIIANNINLILIAYIAYVIFTLSVICWILFLPNSAYLITELNLTHRNMDKNDVPMWYDIVSTLTLSLSGIFNTILGITIIQLFYLIYFDPEVITSKNNLFLNVSAIVIIILVTIGMYLGREIRFNSWDVLHPVKFVDKLKKHFKKEREYINFILFVTIHSIFLVLMYFTFSYSFT